MSAGVRASVLAIARSFIGTPYRHQGSRRGVGCDCLGLIRGVWRELYGSEPEDPGPYTPDWAESSGEDRLMAAALRHLRPVAVTEVQPGDVLLFRWSAAAVSKHCGIVDEGQRLIHAYEGSAVVSSTLASAWMRRISSAFAFPE
ncbi:NlpC/P60 family protein [Mangrovicella endophytica]|uniref:NlpC/P60 family protein n=1 Tax=Mangrovicella endophytica TaxID=2066697 RepID=UPI000C9E8F3C|nr:NlpC/P60 family protein [Mangrovicella endophytica]